MEKIYAPTCRDCLKPATEKINETEPVCSECYEYYHTCPECGIEFDCDDMRLVGEPGDQDLICNKCWEEN